MPALQRRVGESAEFLCIDPNASAAKEMATSLGQAQHFRDVRQAPLDGVSQVLIAADPEAHSGILSDLIGRIPRIFLEKPAGLDAATVLDLHNRAIAAGSIVQVGFNFRFCAGVDHLRQHAAATPLALQASFLSRHPLSTGSSYPGAVEDWLKTNGLHLIDLLAHLWGQVTIIGVQSKQVIDDRFLLQLDLMIGGCRASLLLGNWATKFTMQVTAVTLDGAVVRMDEPSRSPCQGGADRLVDLGYMAELEAFLGPGSPGQQQAAGLGDGVRALEIIEQIMGMLDVA